MELTRVHDLIVRPKSRFGAVEDARIVKRCALDIRNLGLIDPIPVTHVHRRLAWVGIDPRSKRPYALPPGIFATQPTSEDTLINAITNSGQFFQVPYSRSCSASLITGNWYDLWLGGGDPGVGALGAAATAFSCTDATAGALQSGGNVSPATKVPLWWSGFLSTSAAGSSWTLVLYDRVLSYDACTLTGALANMTNVQTAQRYISAGQRGLNIMGAVQVATGGASNLSAVAYTEVGGTGGRAVQGLPTAVLNGGSAVTDSNPANMIIQVRPLLSLQATDTGAKSIQSYTTSAAVAGNLGFTLIHPISVMNLSQSDMMNLTRAVPGCEPIYDGACLNFLMQTSISSATGLVMGMLGFGWV